MAKKTKLIKILATAGCAALLGGLGVQAFNANAADAVTLGGVDVSSFQMEYGASVRFKAADGKNGIRFTATLSDTAYAALEKLEENKEKTVAVDYGVIIVPADQYGEADLTVAKIFGSGSYCFEEATEDHLEECTKTHLATVEYATLANESDKDGVMNLRGSLVDIKTSNLTREFTGVGYIKYTEDNVSTYVMAKYALGENGIGEADIANNTRSMTYVAQKAIEKDEDDDNQTLYNNYVKPLEGKQFKYTVNHHLPDGNGGWTTVTEEAWGTLNKKVSAANIAKSSLENKAEYLSYATYGITAASNTSSILYANGRTVLECYYESRDTVLLDGKSADDLANMQAAFSKNSGTVTITNGETYADANEVSKSNVMKIVIDGENETWGGGYLDFGLDATTLQAANSANWDYITVTMCMTTNVSGVTSTPLYSRDELYGTVTMNEWTEFKISKAQFNSYNSCVLNKKYQKLDSASFYDRFNNCYDIANKDSTSYSHYLFYSNLSALKALETGENVTYYIEKIEWGVDCTAPEITGSNAKVFTEETTIAYTPTVTVADDINPYATASYKMYSVDGAGARTLLTAAEDGSYTLAKGENYVLAVTADDSGVTDIIGNVTTKEYPVSICSISDGVTFDSDAELSYVNETTQTYAAVTPKKSFVSNYEDKNGVSKSGVLKYDSQFVSGKGGGYLYLNFTDAMITDILSKFYTDSTQTVVNTNFKLSVTMCVVTQNANASLYLAKNKYEGLLPNSPLQSNVWTTVELTSAVLSDVDTYGGGWTSADAITTLLKGATSGNFLFNFGTKTAAGEGSLTYYIDSITWSA